MPGSSFGGPLPHPGPEVLEVESMLKETLEVLASPKGERSLRDMPTLRRCETFITDAFERSGYSVSVQEYRVEGELVRNLEVEIPGSTSAGEIIVIGAHYDSAHGPAANDNASGTAGVLSLAEWASKRSFAKTLRFVAFVNEEPPYFQVPGKMGSEVYARRCRERQENIVAMLSLETIGYYSDKKGSQKYPFPLSLYYPNTGNFIAFVGDLPSKTLVQRCIKTFRELAQFPCEGAALSSSVNGVGWSDHWSFWQHGYPALMVTDTAPFRYPHYHKHTDTVDKIDFERTARVIVGLRHVIADLAGVEKTN